MKIKNFFLLILMIISCNKTHFASSLITSLQTATSQLQLYQTNLLKFLPDLAPSALTAPTFIPNQNPALLNNARIQVIFDNLQITTLINARTQAIFDNLKAAQNKASSSSKPTIINTVTAPIVHTADVAASAIVNTTNTAVNATVKVADVTASAIVNTTNTAVTGTEHAADVTASSVVKVANEAKKIFKKIKL